MHAQVEAQLSDLVKLCPTTYVEEKQWDTLYRVALSIHAQGGLPEHKLLKRYLVDQGCSLQKAQFLSRQLLHLCTVLKMHDARRN